ncbi:glycosyltransferase, partial [Ralstonia solanacearum]
MPNPSLYRLRDTLHNPNTGDSGPGRETAPDISVIVIGRNEGLRLQRCLDSVHGADWNGLVYELIYVDSGSVDDSLERARAAGAVALPAQGARPSAAAGRNTGWRAAHADAILFLDGDTLLDPAFPKLALAALQRGRYAAVWGHRRELWPGQSLYTAVLDLDWIYPPGETAYCGGDALFRLDALIESDGFDDSLNAGEEPELCRRLRAAGWRILHLDVPMTLHDLAITRFDQYWRRATRAGQAYAQVAARFRTSADPLWLREAHRNLLHGAAIVALPAVFAAALATNPAVSVVLAAAALLALLRSAARSRWKAGG